MKIICVNRQAQFEYHILDKNIAGLILTGGEIKAIRAQKCNINQAYIGFSKGVPYVYGMNIDCYTNSCVSARYEPKRNRGLLLHKNEIRKLLGKMKQSNYTLIPLNLQISDTGYAKLEFGLCQGKKDYDKRRDIKERELKREEGAAMRKIL